MKHSVSTVQAIYDKAYAHPGLMGTQVDREYSRVTKVSLLAMGNNAPSNRILDLGTGDGDLWQFAPAALEWHAVDISQVGTRRAVDRFPCLHGAVAIAESLPYPDNFFGTVIAADTLEHVFNVETSISEVKRVLAPKGIFALSVPAPNSLRKWAFNQFTRQLPSPLLFARLVKVVIRRRLLFGNAAFQPIDRDLGLDSWCNRLEAQGFHLFTKIEWPPSPLTPIVYLLGARLTK